jgi:hypothetical protein
VFPLLLLHSTVPGTHMSSKCLGEKEFVSEVSPDAWLTVQEEAERVPMKKMHSLGFRITFP